MAAFQAHLLKNQSLLAKTLDLEAFFPALRGLLDPSEIQSIEDEVSGEAKVGIFVEIMVNKRYADYELFRDKLKETMYYKRLAESLKVPSSEDEDTKPCDSPGQRCVAKLEHQGKLEIQQQFLVERMECHYGLIEAMISEGIISQYDFEKIRCKKEPYRQSVELLRVMIRDSSETDYRMFLKALEDTHQRHLAKYICDSRVLKKYGERERPLTDLERKRLRTNQSCLKDLIMTTIFNASLISTECISERHLSKIRSFPDPHDQLAELIEVLLRRSYGQLLAFVDCLRARSQGHIADVLEKNGVVCSAVAVLESMSEKLEHGKKLEGLIAEILTTTPKEETRQMFICSLEEHGITDIGVDVVGARDKKSVKLYFFCETMEILRTIRGISDSGHLKSVTETLFNRALRNTEYSQVVVRLHSLALVDYCKCEDYFIPTAELVTELGTTVQIQSPNRDIRDLPCEVWELILLKAFIFKNMTLSGESQPQSIAFQTLTSVCMSWRKMATKRPWFAKMVREHNVNNMGECYLTVDPMQ